MNVHDLARIIGSIWTLPNTCTFLMATYFLFKTGGLASFFPKAPFLGELAARIPRRGVDPLQIRGEDSRPTSPYISYLPRVGFQLPADRPWQPERYLEPIATPENTVEQCPQFINRIMSESPEFGNNLQSIFSLAQRPINVGGVAHQGNLGDYLHIIYTCTMMGNAFWGVWRINPKCFRALEREGFEIYSETEEE